MSRITINTNTASINAQRRLSDSTRSLSESFQRLSSGMRINRSSDDAAGLAIASSLNTDTRVFNQGIRNFNDGISLLNIAEGALQEASSIVIRMRELATQSANGTLTNTQRQALDEEANALVDEYNRITSSTKFNGLRLIDRSLGNLVLQGGYGVNGQISFQLGDELSRNVASGTFGNTSSFSYTDYDIVKVADVNADGVYDVIGSTTASDIISIRLGQADGGYLAAVNFAAGDSPTEIADGDFNNDGQLDLMVTNGLDNSRRVLFGNGDGTFREPGATISAIQSGGSIVSDIDGDGNLDVYVSESAAGYHVILYGNGNGTFRAMQTVNIPFIDSLDDSASLNDVNGDGKMDLTILDDYDGSVHLFYGAGNGTFQSPVTVVSSLVEMLFTGEGANDFDIFSWGDFDGNGILDFTSTRGGGAAFVALGNTDGSFRAPQQFTGAFTTTSANDFDGDGYLDIVAGGTDNSVHIFRGNGDGTFRAATSYVYTGSGPSFALALDYNGDGASDIGVIDFGDLSARILLSNPAESTTLPHINLNSRTSALGSMSIIDDALLRINTELGAMGAVQSRLSVAINNLDQASENFQSSRSRILDADVAVESATLVRNQILQQAGVAVLSQANQLPDLALLLLQG